jgi:hypothetical protein
MCDGDLRGALKALMLVNEHLESQLASVRFFIGTLPATIARLHWAVPNKADYYPQELSTGRPIVDPSRYDAR